jgi:NAD(P)-dependent dehydrogenase (short-subunit alcohol dehydrogenase family)
MDVFSKQILSGKKLLVTGATSGIGKSVALKLMSSGATVVFVGRSQEKFSKLAELIPPELRFFETVEFRTVSQIAEALDAIVQKYGAFDGVFHSAGVASLIPARLISDSVVAEVFGPSIFGALAVAKVFSKKSCMKDAGSIVFMSSAAASAGQQGLSVYSSSKAAIDGLTRSLAVELSPRTIRVNSVAAGAVISEMHHQIVKGSSESVINKYEAMHPLGFGSPSDIDNLVTFLFTDASRWITGSVIHIDGGYTAK